MKAQGQQPVGVRLAADLTWSQAERDGRFGHMDRIFPVRTVRRSEKVRQLPGGVRLALRPGTLRAYMQQQHLAGVLVLQDGRVRLESYALGARPATRWTGFSMTKSVTDTLVGVAQQQGAIASLDDTVSKYLPEMRGSVYEAVTVRQLMTMTSGADWKEDYTTVDADNVRLYTAPVAPGSNATIEYMRRLSRLRPAGTRWHYNTGETDLLGVLLTRATGKSLAALLSGSAWRSAGAESDATWIVSSDGPAGQEFGGSGLSATLRDWGRLGMWMLDGGSGVLPAGWVDAATRSQTPPGGPAYGYGWWPQADGSFAALGIFGQSILVDPARRLVIVTVGDWPDATNPALTKERTAFWRDVQAAVDAESASALPASRPRP